LGSEARLARCCDRDDNPAASTSKNAELRVKPSETHTLLAHSAFARPSKTNYPPD